jgi:short-subunit dehydrogenase
MKKIALITGATSGIGLEITKFLYSLDYEIYAVGRDFLSLKTININKIKIDFTNLKDVEKVFTKLSKEIEIDLLINCAGFGIFCQHEDIKVNQIENMMNVNLVVPTILSKLFLKSLKRTKGTIINISSIEALKNSKFSALYSATKAGIRAFSLSLFEEVRKDGVKVSVINPDMTNTNFFDNLNFSTSDNNEAFVDTEEIKNIIENIINTRSCISEVTIRPMKLEIKKKKIIK